MFRWFVLGLVVIKIFVLIFCLSFLVRVKVVWFLGLGDLIVEKFGFVLVCDFIIIIDLKLVWVRVWCVNILLVLWRGV